jgi:hypothetical protein
MVDEQVAGLVAQVAQARRKVVEAVAGLGGDQEAAVFFKARKAMDTAGGNHQRPGGNRGRLFPRRGAVRAAEPDSRIRYFSAFAGLAGRTRQIPRPRSTWAASRRS